MRRVAEGPRRGTDHPLHGRARQGRILDLMLDTATAVCPAWNDGDLAGATCCRCRGNPRAVRGASLGGQRLHSPSTARSRASWPIQTRVASLRGLGARRRADGRVADLSPQFCAGLPQGASDTRAARQDSALDDAQWWAANAPLLSRVFDERRYPTAARVGAAAGAAHGARTAPNTPTSSVWSVCSTASPRSLTAAAKRICCSRRQSALAFESCIAERAQICARHCVTQLEEYRNARNSRRRLGVGVSSSAIKFPAFG